MTMDAVLYSAVTAMAATVGLLYRRIETGLKNCEDDRRLLWEAIIKNQNEDRAAWLAWRDHPPKA